MISELDAIRLRGLGVLDDYQESSSDQINLRLARLRCTMLEKDMAIWRKTSERNRYRAERYRTLFIWSGASAGVFFVSLVCSWFMR